MKTDSTRSAYLSCFISYSRQDKDFALWLYNELTTSGVECWLDENDILVGDKIANKVDEGIKNADKVLLCCSKKSLESWWVDDEISKSFNKEQKLWNQNRKEELVLIPLDLDGYLFKWDNAFANRLTDRLAPSFKGWQTDIYQFQGEISRILKALLVK